MPPPFYSLLSFVLFPLFLFQFQSLFACNCPYLQNPGVEFQTQTRKEPSEMGCVSSNLLHHDEEFSHLGGSALSHHIVKLTSTTYGLLSLDPPPSPPPPPMTPPQRLAFESLTPEPKSLWSEPRLIRSEPEVINSWELMSGLDADSFRFSHMSKTPVKFGVSGRFNKENSNPNRRNPSKPPKGEVLKPVDPNSVEILENRVVIYTTSLRGVRRTFEACNAVRAAIEGFGVAICEKDVSMDRGFREELRNLMAREENPKEVVPPKVFVKGRYVGGAEEVLRMVEEGQFGELIRGLPKKRAYGGGACDGCGGVGFLPCFGCNGSCKVVEGEGSATLVVRCPDCNENGLVLCPICS